MPIKKAGLHRTLSITNRKKLRINITLVFSQVNVEVILELFGSISRQQLQLKVWHLQNNSYIVKDICRVHYYVDEER